MPDETRSGAASAATDKAHLHGAFMAFWCVILSTIVLVVACQRSAARKQDSAPSPAVVERPAPAATTRFESPRAVYKSYAEALNASKWADAISVFTPEGQAALVLANFKGLALLAGTEHPKQSEYKAVLRDFCQTHTLDCADERWNPQFTSRLLERGDVTKLMSDVASLATARPQATYIEVMKLLQGVDPSSVVPLDPTLAEVRYVDNTATAIARRADGQTSTMSFLYTSERGWLIAE